MYRGLKETKWSCNFPHKTTGSTGSEVRLNWYMDIVSQTQQNIL